MIKQITLRNFQTHRKLTIKLDRITTIVGPSDLGKSAVVRAVYWACLNSPNGKAFLSHDTERVQVTVLTESAKIVREQGKRNLYKLNGEEFRSFSRTVPKEIEDTLQVSSLNFQRQHDPLFLLSESASSLAKTMNSFVDLESIDKVLAKAALKVRDAKTRVKIHSEQVTVIKHKLKQYRQLPQLLKQFQRIQKQHEHLRKLEQQRQQLHQQLQRLKEVQRQREQLEQVLQAAPKRSLKRLDDLLKQQQLLQRWQRTHKERQRCKQELDNLNEKLSSIKTCPLCEGAL